MNKIYIPVDVQDGGYPKEENTYYVGWYDDNRNPIILGAAMFSLETNSFEKDEEFDEKYGKEFILDLPVIGSNKNEIYFSFCKVEPEENFFGRASVNKYHASNNIFYVHQLQNLYYSLTGEELKITL